METRVGTWVYNAPEVFQDTDYTSSVDIWSIGCIVGRLIYGKDLFDSVQQVFRFRSGQRISEARTLWNPRVELPGATFVDLMVKADPEDRLGVDKLLRHPWVEQFSNAHEELCRAQELSGRTTKHDKLRKLIPSPQLSQRLNDRASATRKIVKSLSRAETIRVFMKTMYRVLAIGGSLAIFFFLVFLGRELVENPEAISEAISEVIPEAIFKAIRIIRLRIFPVLLVVALTALQLFLLFYFFPNKSKTKG